MSTPAPGDLLVQRLPGLPPEFVIADAQTRQTLSSGYQTFSDALARACSDASRNGVSVWQVAAGDAAEAERLIRVHGDIS